jgi:hypothetical protein
MGRVWLARDEMLHRDVAIKEVVLPDGLTEAEHDELCQRTLREARAAGRLSHPNVVAVFDVVQAQGRPWIVMEHVRSRSLYQVIKDDGPVSPKRAAEIGLAVLAALRAAHEAGVWHRDVKPGNVLLADDGRVVLTDFGLATFDGDGTVTRSGVILGSAQYISPERAREGASGPESDMWSLGATLYAAVEGRSPFARDTSMATLTALATAPPDSPRRAGPLRPVLIGLLRKNPRHRMRAAEAQRLLRRIADGDTKGLAGRKAGRAVPLPRPAEHSGGGLAAIGPAAEQPAPPGGHPGRVRTVTEETFRHTSAPRRRRGLMWGAIVVGTALVVPVAVIWFRSGPGSVSGHPPSTSSEPAPAVVLTAQAGVQACAAQSPANETPLPEPAPDEAARLGLLSNWAYHQDSGGFHLKVPATWGVSRIGSLVCFRDTTSAKAVAVYPHGRVAGDPAALLDQAQASWREAAGLSDYELVGITDRHYSEGAADLEYTYSKGAIRMHGVNRMLRMDGRVYTIFFLTTDVSWLYDRAVMDVVQPSFGLDP